MPVNQYSFLQISFAFIMSIGLMNHVLIIPILLEVSARDSWLSVLVSVAMFIPIFLMVGYIIKKTKQNGIQTWLNENYSKGWWVFINLVMIASLIFVVIVTLRDMLVWTNATYLPNTPSGVLGFIFIGFALYTAIKGLRAIVISAGILLPLVFLLGEFVMIANFTYKDYSLLFPIFEKGISPMWSGTIYVGAGLIELIYLVFLQQYVSTKIKKRHLVILGLVIAGLTIGPTMGALAAFGPVEAGLQRSPAFEQWRLVRIGTYIEHVDFLSIYQWMSGAYIRIALALYLLIELIPWRKKIVTAGISILCFGVAIFPIGDITVLRILRKVYYPTTFFVLLALTLLLFLLALFSKPKRIMRVRRR
ncbi:endospore germination permease [Bacillus horti]|uniref:Spore germination protein (Amino acid permease) n=1 Tax=Caldalkalibacillus horti TaxID=77523 RepID=A0ABT9W1N1_9BACI|nr:endospore germination permease [Bacillus horti]MDQ0167167.1 spore germination protein (amino acid permease) [Bacillus horti]